MSKEKIKKMFDELSAEEQGNLLFELNAVKKTIDADTGVISVFAERHQKEYNEDISFTITKSKDKTMLQAILNTTFGKFKGTGHNKRAAKIQAVNLANEAWS